MAVRDHDPEVSASTLLGSKHEYTSGIDGKPHGVLTRVVERGRSACAAAVIEQQWVVLEAHVDLGLPRGSAFVARERETERERAGIGTERGDTPLEQRIER